MKEFIRKNILLLSTLLCAIVIALVLLIMSISITMSRDSTINELDNLKRVIRRLNIYKPAPTKENYKKIMADIKELDLRNNGLLQIFATPYREALLSFMTTLQPTKYIKYRKNNTKELKDKKEGADSKRISLKSEIKSHDKIVEFELNFIKNWKKFLIDESKKLKKVDSKQVLEQFRLKNKYPPKIFKKAKEAFKKTLQKTTFEKLTNSSCDDYIIMALGSPLNLTPVKCKKITTDIKNNIKKELISLKIISREDPFNLFPEFSTLPATDQIPYLLRYCRFYDDLFARITKSKISILRSYRKKNGLRGKNINNFAYLRYEIQVTGELNNLRDLLDLFQKSYKENRIYLIKSLSIKKHVDSVATINREKKIFSRSPSKKDNKINIILGISKLVDATIVLDYIIYPAKLEK